MKCHYEVLEVPRDADDSQIKTAYRKLALKWHPDKNLDNSEAAKEQFQFVQQAYEVLSDRQERAWYDNHRERILRASSSEFEDKILDVYLYFTSTCFSGYSDDEQGFYAVYRRVFEELAHEDIEFMDDKDEFCDIPTFGTSTSDYDQVVGPFYAFWTSYSTKKSYVWLDPYNNVEMRCERRLFKLMERENKKVRLKAKKERNEEVRALVAFVRKRDKRMQEYSKKLEAKILENRQKQEELSKQKRLERKQQLDESQSQAEWTKFDNVKNELEEIEKRLAQQFGEEISDDESDEEEELNLYCVACNKVFKTPKAFENHESSKKHRENVDRLKETMLEDDCDDESVTLSEEELNINLDLDEETIISGTTDLEEEEPKQLETKQKKKQRKSKNVMQLNLSEAEDSFTLHKKENGDVSGINTDFNSTKKQKKKSRRSNNVKVEKAETIVNGANDQLSDEEKPRKNKKLNKRDRKGEIEAQFDGDIDHHCCTCQAHFPSKNKLFNHLKKTGHSVNLSQNIRSLKNKQKLMKEN